MPTRKISERERLTLYARQASDDELDQALEILRVEQRARAVPKAKPATAKKAASKKAAGPAPDTAKDGVITGDQQ